MNLERPDSCSDESLPAGHTDHGWQVLPPSPTQKESDNVSEVAFLGGM